ncbi:MAG: hypothetical protein BWY49_00550 [Candidatus Omnitrophica bacterium ADurb.Bin314]|nr:MAG: hypothetical protein BWY49_00550 [Candidatus Omnitrophica bacterium ADurb.Bin314]
MNKTLGVFHVQQKAPVELKSEGVRPFAGIRIESRRVKKPGQRQFAELNIQIRPRERNLHACDIQKTMGDLHNPGLNLRQKILNLTQGRAKLLPGADITEIRENDIRHPLFRSGRLVDRVVHHAHIGGLGIRQGSFRFKQRNRAGGLQIHPGKNRRADHLGIYRCFARLFVIAVLPINERRDTACARTLDLLALGVQFPGCLNHRRLDTGTLDRRVRPLQVRRVQNLRFRYGARLDSGVFRHIGKRFGCSGPIARELRLLFLVSCV